MANPDIDVLGAVELMKVLDDLPNDLGVKVLKTINRSGANIFRNEIRAASPGETIPKNIKVQSDKFNKTGFLVGIGRDAFMARFKEFGTVVRKTKGKGKVQKKAANRGQMTAKPFIQPAIERVMEQAITAIFDGAGKRVYNFLRRETRKVNKMNR